MSRAFTKETDDQWLDEIPPTLKALISFLSKENNGILVYEKSSSLDEASGKTIHKMSNGSSYVLNADGRWTTITD